MTRNELIKLHSDIVKRLSVVEPKKITFDILLHFRPEDTQIVIEIEVANMTNSILLSATDDLQEILPKLELACLAIENDSFEDFAKIEGLY